MRGKQQNEPLEQWRVLPWLGGALLFTGACWVVVTSPERTAQLLREFPSLLLQFWNSGSKSLLEVLPPQPVSLQAAFRLGELASSGDAADLAEASTLVRGGAITLEQLLNMPASIAEMQLDQSWAQRLLGIFSFTNALWVGSITLIGVTIFPAVYVIAKPFAGFFRQIARWLWDNVIQPTAIFCHQYGVAEAAAWCGSVALMLDALRLGSSTAPFVGLSSVVAAGLALTYSTLRHGVPFVEALHRRSKLAPMQLAHAWLAACLFPLAYAHESTLLGFGAVAAAWASLGFSVLSGRLAILIGFENEDALARCSFSSAALLAAYTWARVRGQSIDSPELLRVLEVFGLPVSVFGSLMLGLAVLIESSDLWHENRSTYARRNVLALGTLLTLLGVGNVLVPSSGMASTATVFLALYGSQKYAEFHWRRKWSGWILGFLGGVAGWRAALWVHNNPELIAKLLQA